MAYLDYEALDAVDEEAFQGRTPYPWVNPADLLTAQGFETLRQTLPDVSLFAESFGKQRRYGQQSHDYWTLEYEPSRRGDLEPEWQEFMAELQADRYREFVYRLFGTRHLDWRYHWHYHPSGCSVSPHCDSRRKLGSHIFYFNTDADWKRAWGGETCILDDGGRFSYRSAPDFGDFDRETPSEAIGNYSLLFRRRGNSWHGVREIRCPEDARRKVFIVVVNRASAGSRLRGILGR